MADVITRFKLETTQYDSKLRDAAKGLKEVAHMAELGGKGFKDFNQKQIEAARAFGQVESGANNAKDKVKDLVGAFNEAARAYNNLSQQQQQSDFGKALSQSLDQLSGRIKEAKQELYGLGDAAKSGSMFGDGSIKGMLQVFGGNLMTKAAGYVASLGSEIVTVMNQSAELAKQAEGVEIAFARLGRGDLLDGLREATHGTVSDFELMKAAVKFNDFKLPLEELGTMLAFAQQKAKDTGQSVDYMVDSIVTGLGRKSLMILDNLGLSASEVKDKMAETGDMTKAVGEIIREQMQKAGDYVETAADRATQANVELENAMLELGNAMRDTFGYTGWSDMAAGIKTELVGAITFTIETINEAKMRFMELMQLMGIADKPKKPQPSSPGPNGAYYETTDSDGTLLGAGRWMNGNKVQTTAGEVVVYGNAPDKTNKTSTTGGSTKQNLPEYADFNKQLFKSMNGDSLKNEIEHLSPFEMFKDQAKFDPENILGSKDAWEDYKDTIAGTIEGLGDSFSNLTEWTDNFDPYLEKMEEMRKVSKQEQMAMGLASQAVGSFSQALAGMEDPATKAAGTVIQAIASIALGFATASAQAGSLGPFGWIAWLAAGMAALATTISTVHSLTGYANGGMIEGNSYSGDNLTAMGPDGGLIGLNAGEVILNKAQQNSLADQLTGNGLGNINLRGVLRGTDIVLSVDRSLKSSGRGELMTWG